MEVPVFVRRLLPRRILIRMSPYRKLEVNDSDHLSGKWEYLESLTEFAHYSVIAGYYCSLRPHSSVVDIGCGAGRLQRALVPCGYSRYLGIDISRDAIERASSARQPGASYPNTTFVVGDVEQSLELDGLRFDVVILNESLYYFEKPVELLSRLANQVLAPDGIFIISMHRTLNSQRLWRLLLQCGWRPSDITTVSNGAGVTWTIAVLTIRRAPSGLTDVAIAARTKQ